MKYPNTFVIFTGVLLLITGVFIYITHLDDAALLAHVPDPDWLRPHIATPSLKTIFSKEFAVDDQGRSYAFWGALDSAGDRPELQYQVLSAKGNVVQKPKGLTEGVGSWEFAATVHKEQIHLFWVEPSEKGKMNLHYSRFDLKGTLLEEKTVLTHVFVKPKDFQVAVAPNGQFMLAWLDQESDRVQGHYHLQTLLVDEDGMALGERNLVASSEHDYDVPNLVADAQGRFHLAWIQAVKTESSLFTVHQVYYQSFNPQGVAMAEPRYIDEAGVDRVGLAVKDDMVYLAWNKVLPITQSQRKQSVETVFENYVIYGGMLNVNHPEEPIMVKMLTPEIGPYIDQNLVIDAAGQIQMVYVTQYLNFMALTHSTYDENLEMIKQPKRIYPEQRLDHLGVTASIFADAQKGIHLFWEDGSSHGKMFYYYANTKQDGRVSPLQVIGLNTNNLVISSVVSLGFTLIMPFINILFNLIFFVIVFVALCWRGITEVLQRLGIQWVMESPYMGPAITVVASMILYSQVGIGGAFFTPYHPTMLERIFLLGTATVACAVYLWLNKTKKGTLTVCIATATLWVFWVNMMSQIFTLPGWNYFMSV